jgi:NADH:ubiquinone oxidoreductase subunit 4 (subunit M)
MVGKVVFGSLKEPEQHEPHQTLPADLSLREVGVLIPLALLCVWIGVKPIVLTDAMQGSVEEVLSPFPRIVQQQEQAPTKLIEIKDEQHG